MFSTRSQTSPGLGPLVAIATLALVLTLPSSMLLGRPVSSAITPIVVATDHGATVAARHFPTQRAEFPSVAGRLSGTTPRNVLVVGPCSIVGNAEVESAFDPVARILYDAWIGCGGIGFARSLDGGYSFSPGMTVLGSAGSSIGQSWDPSIAVAPNGTVYVAFMVHNGTGDAPVVAWSWNYGASFAGSQFAFRPGGAEFSDREFIAVAPNGTVVLTWNYAPNGTVVGIQCPPGGSCYFTSGDFNAVIVRSFDGGKNWTSPVHIDPEYPWGGAVAAPVVIEPNGTVDVLYEDYNVTAAHALTVGYNYFVASYDGGAHFQPRVRVSNYSFPNTDWWIDGALAEDKGRTLYASFDALGAGHDNAYVALSTTHGTTWAPAVRANADLNSGLHIEVGVVGGENGTAYVAWMSNATGGGWHTYALTVSGNGTNLSTPTVVSAGSGLNGYWVGDTIGLSYLGAGGLAVSWTYALDTGSGSQVYGAVIGVTPPGVPAPAAVRPGPGQVTVSWTAPPDRWVAGYQVTWGVEGQPSANLTLSSASRNAVVTNLTAFIHYFFEIAAFNAGGFGLPTVPIKVTLIGWAFIHGTLTPGAATVVLDGHPVAVANGGYVANTTPGTHLLQASEPTFANADAVAIGPWNGSVWLNLTLSPLPGTLAGTVNPHTASVTWDGSGVSLTSTGQFSVQAPAGAVHVLRMTALGYNPVQFNETLPQGGTLYLNVTMRVLNGTVALTVSPNLALVLWNGSRVHVDGSGTAVFSAAPGRYTLIAQAPGYELYLTNVSVRPGERVPVNISLHPLASSSTNQIAGLPAGTFDLLVIFGVTALVLGVVALVSFRRRPPPDPGLGAEEQGPAPPSDVYVDDFPPNLGERPAPEEADWRYV